MRYKAQWEAAKVKLARPDMPYLEYLEGALDDLNALAEIEGWFDGFHPPYMVKAGDLDLTDAIAKGQAGGWSQPLTAVPASEPTITRIGYPPLTSQAIEVVYEPYHAPLSEAPAYCERHLYLAPTREGLYIPTFFRALMDKMLNPQAKLIQLPTGGEDWVEYHIGGLLELSADFDGQKAVRLHIGASPDADD